MGQRFPHPAFYECCCNDDPPDPDPCVCDPPKEPPLGVYIEFGGYGSLSIPFEEDVFEYEGEFTLTGFEQTLDWRCYWTIRQAVFIGTSDECYVHWNRYYADWKYRHVKEEITFSYTITVNPESCHVSGTVTAVSVLKIFEKPAIDYTVGIDEEQVTCSSSTTLSSSYFNSKVCGVHTEEWHAELSFSNGSPCNFGIPSVLGTATVHTSHTPFVDFDHDVDEELLTSVVLSSSLLNISKNFCDEEESESFPTSHDAWPGYTAPEACTDGGYGSSCPAESIPAQTREDIPLTARLYFPS